MTRPYKRGPMCSHCDNERNGNDRYCKACRASYNRDWRAKRAKEWRQFKRMKLNVSRETIDNNRAVGAEKR